MRTALYNSELLKSTGIANPFISFARKQVRKKLGEMPVGCIAIVDPLDHWQSDTNQQAEITIEVHDPRFYLDVMLAGSNGAASAYRDGYWSCTNLLYLFQLMVRNLQTTDRLESGFAAVGNWWLARRHRARSNTRQGSHRNIHAHYDLGNDVFALFLDPTMTYSSGIFPTKESSLEEASIAKLEKICLALDIKPQHHLIEIGSGWGSFSMHAAKYFGCRVTTTTISRAQYDLAKQRIEEAGLQDRIELLLCDYRDLKGNYDRLVSIEMIEAVGHEFLSTYFGKCADLLRPGGRALIQAITMPDLRYEQYLGTTDFIREFIFPGSCVPSVTAMLDAISEFGVLEVDSIDDFRSHYATTLQHWRRNFMARLDEVRDLGYNEEFIRLWEYYLCYCEAGFRERYTGVVHLELNKPVAAAEVAPAENTA